MPFELNSVTQTVQSSQFVLSVTSLILWHLSGPIEKKSVYWDEYIINSNLAKFYRDLNGILYVSYF
jgi:hypothetical protein